MFKQRLITALLLLPLVGVILFVLDLRSFAAAILLVNGVLAWEWARLSGIKQPSGRVVYAISIVALCVVIWLLAPGLVYWPSPNGLFEWHHDSSLIIYWLSIAAWLVALLSILCAPQANRVWDQTPWPRLAIGAIILAGFWVSVVSIRGQGAVAFDALRGGYLVLFMLTIIWAADVGGYVFGKAFGKRKLAPSISPGKTWEGFFGGMAMSVLIAVLGANLLELKITHWWLFCLAAAALGVISVFGDLFESLLKRQENLKDSSQLLPGHGGFMDRLDSTIAVAPFFLLIAYWLRWF